MRLYLRKVQKQLAYCEVATKSFALKNFIYYTSKLFATLFYHVLFRVEIRGRENLPPTGKLILAPNHQSNLDPPLVQIAAGRDVFFVAKKQLFRTWWRRLTLEFYHAIPIDRQGLDVQAVKRINALLEQEEALVMFPEGRRSRDGKLLPPRGGVGMLALKTGAAVIPVLIMGTLDATLKPWRRERIFIRFGSPLHPTEVVDPGLPQREKIARMSQVVMDRIRTMQEEYKLEYKLGKSGENLSEDV